LMMKVPKGFNGLIQYESGPFRAIVVDGTISHQHDKNDQPALLAAGSYLGTSLKTSGGTSFNSQTGAVLYIRAQAALELIAE